MFVETHSEMPLELVHGQTKAQDLLRRAQRLVDWFQNVLFSRRYMEGREGQGGRTPEQAVAAMGGGPGGAAMWFRTIELACRFINNANKICGVESHQRVVPEGWKYQILDDGRVVLEAEAPEPIALAAAGAETASIVS